METTFNIDSDVVQRLRAEAAKRGATMSALVEEGLRHVLDEGSTHSDETECLPALPRWRSGGHLVDVSNRSELYRVMEED